MSYSLIYNFPFCQFNIQGLLISVFLIISEPVLYDTVMHYAAKLGRFRELKAMIDKGGNPFLKNRNGQNVESLLRGNPNSASPIVDEILAIIERLKQQTPHETNESLVHAAVRKNSLKRLKLFYNLGASLESFNLTGQTPRDVAVELELHHIVQFIDGCTLTRADEVTHF